MTAGAHNGMPSQLNLWFQQIAGDFMFINMLKSSQIFALSDFSNCPAPDTLNSNGYPISVSNGGVASVCYVPTQAERPGQYVVKFTADASGRTVNMDFAAYTSTGAGTHRALFTPGSARLFWEIKTVGVSNLVVCHVDDEAAYDAGARFTTKFLTAVSKFGLIRFLDSQLANISNVRYWADRKPIDYVYYFGDEFRASVYGGVTTNSGDDYTVTAPSGWAGLVDKAMVSLKFNATASGNLPRLRVGVGGTYKQICRPYGDAMNSDVRPTVNGYATLVYDADLDVWLKFGGSGAEGAVFLTNGIPPEMLVQLCEEIGAHPWFVPPFLTCDPLTDFMPSLAAYCHGRGTSTWMKPTYEAGPNETWNSAGGFYGTRYAWNKGDRRWVTPHTVTMTIASPCVVSWTGHGMSAGTKFRFKTTGALPTGVLPNQEYQVVATGLTADSFRFSIDGGATTVNSSGTQSGTHSAWAQNFLENDWYGMGTTRLGKALDTEYAGNRTKYALFIGCWAAIGSAYHNRRLAATYYVAETGNAGDAARLWATDLGPAIYFGPSIYGSGTESTMATAYAAAGTPAQRLKIANDYASDCLNPGSALTQIKATIDDYAAYAAANGLGLMSYEGGYSPDTGAGATIDTLRLASKNAPVMRRILSEVYEYYRTKGGKFPSCYMLSGSETVASGEAPRSVIWSIDDPNIYAPKSEQRYAIEAFAENKRVWSMVSDIPVPDAPILTWTTGPTDNTPSFSLTLDDPVVGDTVQVQVDNASDFSSVNQSADDTLSSGEVAAQAITPAITALANGTWYVRVRHKHAGGSYSAWSNTVSQTISVSSAVKVYRGTNYYEDVSLTHSASIDIGAAAADRLVIVGIASQNSQTIASVTANGVSLTQRAFFNGDGGGATETSGIYAGVVASGSGAQTIAVVYNSGAAFNSRDLFVWTVTGLGSNTPVDTDAVGGNSAHVDVQVGDFLFAVSRVLVTFNGSTETPDANRAGTVAGAADWTIDATVAGFDVHPSSAGAVTCAAVWR